MAERDFWIFFVEEAKRLRAPLYARLAAGALSDPELHTLTDAVRPGQPAANMLLGAVHFVLLRGAQHPLRDFYANLGGRRTVDDADPYPLFREFVLGHFDEIRRLVATRVTNTNEVGRSAILHAGFRVLAAKSGAPLHLVEIGPSAGLNMIWDLYGVRYLRGCETFETDTPDAELTLETALRGQGIPPLGRSPRVASRVGLENSPVDLDDHDSRDWLRALVWPDHPMRFRRLDAALSIYARHKPEIRRGDALALLPEALAGAPANQTLCVYHTFVTYQFSPEMREALDNMLATAGLRRPVWRLAVEFGAEGDHPLRLIRYRDGTVLEETLALCDPHGAWIEWQA
ncbi:MAG TPA: DUF2332 domain-containing protein [Rhizomicrobium sp.]|nr:DUF2332 domain-containing protein [Rhizomicrobium sp.]